MSLETYRADLKGCLGMLSHSQKTIAVTDNTILIPKATYPIDNLTINDGGSNYIVGDEITISGGSGSNFSAVVASVNSETGAITAINIINNGTGYSTNETVNITSSEGSGADLTVSINRLKQIKIYQLIISPSAAVNVSLYSGTNKFLTLYLSTVEKFNTFLEQMPVFVANEDEDIKIILSGAVSTDFYVCYKLDYTS